MQKLQNILIPQVQHSSNTGELKNFEFITNATWDSNTAQIETELPHDLQVGTDVELINIESSVNTVGTANTGLMEYLQLPESVAPNNSVLVLQLIQEHSKVILILVT